MGRFCCVPNCKSSKKGHPVYKMRVIPVNDCKRLKIWVQRIGSPKLNFSEDLNYLDHLYRTLRVCDRHFDSHCKLEAEGKLMKDSLPTLHLPNFHEESTIQNSLLRNYSKISSEEIRSLEVMSSTPGPSSNTNMVENSLRPLTPPSSNTNTVENSLHPITPKRQYNSILKSVNVGRKNCLSPKASKIYTEFNRLKKLNRRLKTKCGTYKEKMKCLMEDIEAKMFKSLNTVSINFFHSQCKHQKKRPRGRRFTLDEKNIRINIYETR
ncbi:hypothetical protein ABEB36_015615 [Hypothenemus hampei]|uniref:THAP-type domain-containing protein n=1 Tax=Hypothenemus hampei TaxID=57062 RepID=A0ABD1DZH2_HYPHA